MAQAASLGKVDVASHLGEPFYAEVPLGLDEGEAISSVFVELASPADYQILEVFRDSEVGAIRTDVKSDSRGSRVELTSTSAVEAPFLNLILKVRYGHATHFKKFSIFLDLPRAANPNTSKEKVLPVKRIEDISANPMLEAVPVEEKVAQETQSSFTAYDGWARTEQYGPMVYGDTISTVAERLRVDARYSRQQVMMALFEKNKSKFAKENINLINAGTYLNVPSAQEVEHITRSQAVSLLKEHNAKWKELTKQTKYARVQEAQKNRYGKHVRMGETASGVASQPIAQDNESSTLSNPALETGTATIGAEKTASTTGKKSQNNEAETALRQENDSLQQRLKDMEAKMAKLAAQPTAAEGLAASNARIKKLELQLARQVGELEKARKQASMQQGGSQGMGLMTWILIGIVALLAMIAGYLAYALRGQRSHPVDYQEDAQSMMEPVEEVEEIDVEVADVEEANVAEAPEVEGSNVEPVDFEATLMASADDLQAPLTETIPELTDEDTSEMEAFTEAEEEPDPNVDYLSEADVYMRYGMEDEAEKQVSMALRLRADNKDAHVKLVQIRHARGNQSGVEEAVTTARSVLVGDALATFTTAFDALEAGTVNEDEASLDDTMPPTTLEELTSSSADEEALQADSSLDMSDVDLPDFDNDEPLQELPSNAADEEVLQADDSLDIGEVDLPDLDSDEPSTESDDSAAEMEDSLDLGDLDWSSESDVDIKAEDSGALLSEMATENATEDSSEIADSNDSADVGSDVAEQEAFTEDTTDVEEVVEEPINLGDSLDNLNLSDLEMPDLDVPDNEEASVASSLEETDLDRTVVMDWSKDTSVITAGEDIGGESGADHDAPAEADSASDEAIVDLNEANLEEGLDIDLSALEEEETSSDDVQEGSSSTIDDELSSMSFSLDDLDVDLDATPDDGDIDDFTSTIQSTLIDLGVKEEELDVSLEPVDEDEPESGDQEKDDFDADLELDNLLSDLDDFSSDDKDKK
ncbi:MAG: FimV/HubP family polar landmark protein [Mariprofundaceae bacterium]|nr:FimV/HubP family polar landmark protein [Mariprofundaceae bacterium]